MKRPAAYLFLIIYLFSFTEVRQVLKVPDLVEHYISHQMLNGETSILSFLKIHYLDDHPLDSDYEQDMKLPFKKYEMNGFSLNLCIIPEYFDFQVKAPEIFLANTPIFSYCPSYSSSPSESLLRPPISV